MANGRKYGAAGRKHFLRTEVPMAERAASVAILLLLAAMALTIYRQGKIFDPNRYAVRTEALKSTAAAVAGKADTLSAETESKPAPSAVPKPAAANAAEGEGSAEGDAQGAEAAAGAAPKPELKHEPLQLALAGVKSMVDTEYYNSDNLYEKIDGRAPAYQSFNIQQLRCRSFGVNAVPGSYVDVYEYRFDTPVNAFGMFAMERDPKGKPLTILSDGYSSDMGYFFRQGAVYVQIIASDTKPETLAKAKSIADIRAKDLPADDTGLAGRRKLPVDGLISDSVAYVAENAQGQGALKDVFQAKYKFDGGEQWFFVMAEAPADAAKAWKAFQDFCGKFGKLETLPDVAGAKLFAAQLFGKWKVVYERGGELGGAFDAGDEAPAKAFVEKYLRGELK